MCFSTHVCIFTTVSLLNHHQLEFTTPTYMVINGVVIYMLLLLQLHLHNCVQKLKLPSQLILSFILFITSLADSAIPGARGFFDLAILQRFCRVTMYIQWCGVKCHRLL